MNKNVTIKDIAKKAGVSVATVSYVINNRRDMRISESTRKKVLQIVNLLGYTPNQSAQALVTSRSRMAAIIFSEDSSPLKKAEQQYFLESLSDFMQEKNYDVIYLNSSFREKYDRADAIFCYDMSRETFLAIGDVNFSPLLAVDCIIDDPLFFQINMDYEALYQKADAVFAHKPFTLCILDSPNQEKKQRLQQIFPQICFISRYEELSPLLAPHHTEPILTVDFILAELLQGHPHLLFEPAIRKEQMEILLSSMENALSHEEISLHDVLVPIAPV